MDRAETEKWIESELLKAGAVALPKEDSENDRLDEIEQRLVGSGMTPEVTADAPKLLKAIMHVNLAQAQEHYQDTRWLIAEVRRLRAVVYGLEISLSINEGL
jgi:hypothetical protein